RGHRLLRTDSMPRNYLACGCIRPPEQPRRERYFARLHSATDFTRRDGSPAPLHWSDHASLETIALSQSRQHINVAGLAVPEAEVVAHNDGPRPQSMHQPSLHELFRSPMRHVAREGEHQHVLDSFARQYRAAFRLGGEQARRPLWRDDGHGMRIEGQYRGLQTFFSSRTGDFTQQFVVTGMNAIEVADGHGHRFEPGGFL